MLPATLLSLKETATHVLSSEYCEMFKDNFFLPLATYYVLRTIKLLSFNHALENLCTLNNFSFTNFLSDRVMEWSTKRTS